MVLTSNGEDYNGERIEKLSSSCEESDGKRERILITGIFEERLSPRVMEARKATIRS